MRRASSIFFAILLIFIIPTAGLFSQAQGGVVIPEHSLDPVLSVQPERSASQPAVQTGNLPGPSLPKGVPEFAAGGLTPQQAQLQAQKEQAKQNREAWQLIQQHDHSMAQSGQDSSMKYSLSLQAGPALNPQVAQKPLPIQFTARPVAQVVAGDEMLGLPPAPSITLETVHLNTNFGIASTVVITNEAVVSVDIALQFLWPNGVLQGTYNLTLSPGNNYYLDVSTMPFLGSDFVGSINAAATDLISGDILTPDYGLISGTVFDTDGTTPIVAPWVELWSDYGNNNFPGQGGYAGFDDGNFYIGGLPDGTYVLRASKGYPYASKFFGDVDLAENSSRIAIGSGSDFTTANIILQPGGRISGTVYAADGFTPLPNINMDLGQGWYGTCTDTNGNFTMENIPYGDHVVRAGGDYNWCVGQQSIYPIIYYAGVFRMEQAASLTLAGGQDSLLGIDFSLSPGGVISGTVRGQISGQPLANIHVAASIYDQNDEWYWGHAWTDPAGNYTITGLPDGDYRVRIDDSSSIPDGYARQYYDHTSHFPDATPVAIVTGQTVTGIDFDLPPGGSISGTVYAADGGAPLPNINMDLEQGWYGTCTDANGHFFIGGVPYGDHYVRAGGDYNWCVGEQSIYVREYYQDALRVEQASPLTVSGAQANLTGIDFNLDIGGVITGVVLAEQGGQPLQNVHVMASIYDPNDEWYWSNSWTDAAGNYTISGLPDGDYRVRIDDSSNIPAGYSMQYYDHTWDYNGATPVQIAQAGTVSAINFDLPPGGLIRGRVTDQLTGDPIPNMKVDASGRQFGAGVCSDSQGYYELRGLPFGDYTLTAGGYNWCQQQPSTYAREFWQEAASFFDQSNVPVTDTTPVEGIDFTLSHGGYISGKVTDGSAGGIAVEGLRVVTFVMNPNDRDQWFWNEEADTDAQGNYTIGPLAAWDYKVYACVECTGQLLASEYYQDVYDIHDGQDVPVTEGNTTSGIDLVLGKGVWITGHVSVPEGYSPEGITIDAWVFDYNFGTQRLTDANGDYIVPVPPVYDSMWGIAARPYNTDLESEWAHRVWLEQDSTWDFDLGPGARIEGCITDGGNPVPMGWISAESSWMNEGASVGQDGCYSINNLPPGEYRVRADAWPDYYPTYFGSPNWEYATPIRLDAGEVESGIDFEMHRLGALSGVARDFTTQAPLEGIQVVAMNAQGYFQAWSQVDGTYNLDVPVGDYKVFYMQDSWEDYFAAFYPYATSYEAAQTVSVQPYNPNGSTTVNIDLHKKAWVSGTVTDSVSGQPRGGIFVKVYTMGAGGSFEPSWTASTCTGMDGSFSLEAFWPGKPYKITAVGTCGAFSYQEPVTKDITVEPGGSYVENIQVTAGGPVDIPFTIRTNETDFLPENNPADQNLALLFEPLVKLDDQGNWTSNLLQQVPTVENGGVQVVNNQMVVTYALKPGMLWSDGVPLTSADIRYAWQRIDTPTMWWNFGGSITTLIERVETPDPLTAVVYFHKDQIWHNYLDAIPYAMPEHVLQGEFPFMFNNSHYLENPVGNGPYIVEDFLADSHVNLRANPNYVLRSQGLPRIERIRQLSVGDPYWLVSNGLAQVAVDLADGEGIPSEAGDFLNVQASTTSMTEFLWLNNEAPAFQDLNVRQALLMALDRATLAEYGLTKGYPSFIPAENFFTPDHPMYSDVFTRYNYSLVGAAAMLDAAGWTDHDSDSIRDKGGVKMEFTLGYPQDNDRRMRLATTFQEDLGTIGVRLTLLPQPDFSTLTDNGRHGMFDIFPVAWIFERYVAELYPLFHSSQIPTAYNSYDLWNFARWQNPLNDTLLEATLNELSFSVLKGTSADWTQNLMDLVPSLPTVHSLKYDIAAPTLVNFKPGENIPATWNAAEWFQPANPFDLGVRKTLALESAAPQPGATIIYDLKVDNSGFFGVTNATLVDTLPDLLTYVNAVPAPTTTAGNKLYWNLGNLAAGQKPPTIKLTVLVSALAQHNDKITNQVQVYADEEDTRPSNNAVSYTVTVREDVDLWLEKHGIGQPAIGEKFTYFIEYGNLGGAPASGVVVTDTLPAEVTLISADPAPDSQDGSLLTWNIGDLAGDQWGGQIEVIAEIAAPGHVVNKARVEPVPGETITLNNFNDHIEDVSTILAPVILRPTQGTTDGSFPVKGLAPSNAIVTIYNILEPLAPVVLGSGTATATGTFEIPLSLPEGSYVLAAKAEKATLTSDYSNVASIVVSHSLPLDPDEVTIKVDGVDFSAGVVRAEQYMLSHRLLEIDALLPCATAPSAVSLLVNENGIFNYTVAPVALLDQGGGKWKSSFRFWLAEPHSNYDVKIAWTCQAVPLQELLVYILIDPDGYVYDQAQVDAGSTITASLISEATITAYAKVGEDWVIWPANLYGQHNPQVTDATTEDEVMTPGYYSFLTPPGQYRIEATAPGYQPYQSDVLTVISDPIHLDVGLTPVKGGTSVAAAPADLSASHMSVDLAEGTLGSVLTYDLYLVNQGELNSGTLTLQATIPANTTYLVGSLTSDGGEASFNATDQAIEWDGTLAAGQVVHISYKVKVSGAPRASFTVSSQATLDGPSEVLQGVGNLSASTAITMKMVYLPMVSK